MQNIFHGFEKHAQENIAKMERFVQRHKEGLPETNYGRIAGRLAAVGGIQGAALGSLLGGIGGLADGRGKGLLKGFLKGVGKGALVGGGVGAGVGALGGTGLGLAATQKKKKINQQLKLLSGMSPEDRQDFLIKLDKKLKTSGPNPGGVGEAMFEDMYL